MLKWVCCILAGIYLFLYPSILLVPEEYRQGFWSADFNVPRRGLIVEREIFETKSVFNEKIVYRIRLLVDGSQEYFWAANTDIVNKLRTGELINFETRGRVIVLASADITHPPIVSLLNY